MDVCDTSHVSGGPVCSYRKILDESQAAWRRPVLIAVQVTPTGFDEGLPIDLLQTGRAHGAWIMEATIIQVITENKRITHLQASLVIGIFIKSVIIKI